MDCSLLGSSVHGGSSGRNIGVDCHALQGIFRTQGLNPGLPQCRQILYRLSHQGTKQSNDHALKYCTLVCVMELPQVAQWSGIHPPMQAMRIQSLGQEDLLEEGTATHSSILAWRIPGTEKPVRLQSTGSQRVGHDWSNSSHKHMYYTSIKKKRPSQQKAQNQRRPTGFGWRPNSSPYLVLFVCWSNLN